ncbi:MAG: dihydroorotase [Burkholderiales bacterium]
MDCIIKGGRVVTGGTLEVLDIGIQDGRIAFIGSALPLTASTRVIDAGGLVVLPGLVDVHVHLRDPGLTHKEDFYSGTTAAASAGITTVVAQPNTNPAITTPAAFAAARASGEHNAVVDFGISAAATEENLEHLEALVACGSLSLDFPLGGSGPALTVRSNATLLAILEVVARTGTFATVYTGDNEVSSAARERLQHAGRKDALAYADAFPAATELLGTGRLIAAAIATGARVHIRQVSCPETVALANRNMPLLKPGHLTLEVTPHHLYLDRSAIQAQGVLAVMGPPLRTPDDAAAMRRALRDGQIQIVTTDHAPHLRSEKEAGRDDVWRCPPGTPGLETFLPSLLAAVHRGEMSLPDLANVACEQPARLFGLHPRKGSIRPGADADLVIVDPAAPFVVDPERFFSKARYSPFSGSLRGKVHTTLVRGTVVYQGNGAEPPIRVPRGFGRFLAPTPAAR